MNQNTKSEATVNGLPGGRFASLLLFVVSLCATRLDAAPQRPNVLWITSEDNGPYLGCYGDPLARTPNIDRLAGQGVRYVNCFSNAAVCAPARQTLISGMYATSLGGQHMRSQATFPPGVVFFPKYMRDAGYYTSNNSKTDYNGGPADGRKALQETWDESSGRAHWRNRPPGKPFFSVFNIGDSHESRLFPARWNNREQKTDPAKVKLPAYLPDVPEIRLDLARYYDCLEAMDEKVGRVLRELDEDGLADETIVFYFADHGGSLPRGKSFTYDSGTHVPLVIRFPKTWRHLSPAPSGETTDRPVSFVDFSATVLSLVGVTPPAYMQGHAFLGSHESSPREFVHTFRGRRGERYDIVRGVRDKEFLYLRNYTPHLPVMQYNGYSFGIPSYIAWMDAWTKGACNQAQAQWFEPKASEELYRIADDPDNVRNLAGDSEFADVLARMRAENDRHIRTIRDSVFYPEGMNGREFAAYQDDERYPLDQLIELANAVSARDQDNVPRFRKAMQHENPCVRYWAVAGCVVLGEQALSAEADLTRCLTDSEPVVRLQTARALAGMGETKAAIPVIRHYAEQGTMELALQAVLAIDECNLLKADPSLRSTLNQIKGQYASRVVKKLSMPPAQH
jgi:N-sulfoglucosamine sulfohydrolase